MAKKKEEKKAMEEVLWQSANKLRGKVESSQYKHIVLSLIFLKVVSDKFDKHRDFLREQNFALYLEQPAFYGKYNVLFLTEETRWSYLVANASQDGLALKIDKAFTGIEKDNATLKGALPKNLFTQLGLEQGKLKDLINEINKFDTKQDSGEDVVGRVYEYFLRNFALAEGKKKGEFYTPKSVVQLLVSLIEPYKGKIYDPACGSGGMFVQSFEFIQQHEGNTKEVVVYGQEYTEATYKLAKMNLALRGISANFGERAADTFSADQHKERKFDFIMANPPFNQKDWRAENELTDDPRWNGYEVPPTSNANYAWILHIVSKLAEDGVAGFILANGALSGTGTELEIRKKLIENDLVEAIIVLPKKMFYTTDISVTLWIVNKNKREKSFKRLEEDVQYRDRSKQVLFMDLRTHGEIFEKQYIQFSNDDIQKFSKTFEDWRTGSDDYMDTKEYCYSASLSEIETKKFSLVPSKYIEFDKANSNIDFEAEMKVLSEDIGALYSSNGDLMNKLNVIFEGFGYGFK